MRIVTTAFLTAALLAGTASAAVFQYSLEMDSGKDAFLWIPPEAKQVRGVIMGGMTLMEREFVKDSVIRKACADQQLALIFLRSGLGSANIQNVLDRFAKKSGYRELSVAPLMFVGHSAGGPPAQRIASKMADRCFGLVQYRGGGPGGKGPLPAGVPALMMVGQFDEFGGRMRRKDGSETWDGSRKHMAAYRGGDPNRLAAVVVEPGAGHFAWSDRNAKLLAMWIRKAAEARIPETWPVDAKKPPQLNKIDAAGGWVTDLQIEKASESQPARQDKYEGNLGGTNWHFDKEMAEAVMAYHKGIAGKKDQFITWENRYWVDAGTRFFFLGLDWVDDGQTFEVKPVYAEKVPGQYNGRGPIWPKAGQAIGHADAPLKIKPVSGPLVAVGKNRFRIRFDNLEPAGERFRATFMAYSQGDDEFRYTEQVGMMPRGFRGLRKGKQQTITFPEIKDTKADAEPVELSACSNSGLPVEYYVAYGPAVVEDGALKITQVPARAEFPIEVKVVAYQFGSGVKPQFKTAEPASRTFRITAP